MCQFWRGLLVGLAFWANINVGERLLREHFAGQ